MDARQFPKHTQSEFASATDVVLSLDWDGLAEPLVLDNGEAIVVGRNAGADVCFPQTSTSRVHARIQWQGTHFLLSDCSTNGSFLRTEDEQIRFIRREGVRLWGEGSICFAGSDFSSCVLKFRHISG